MCDVTWAATLCAELTVRLVVQLHKAPTALEAPVGKEGDATVADMIQDDSEESAEDAATMGMMTKDMENLLYTLSEREGDVLRLRYGLDDGREKTLEEVGRILLVSFVQTLFTPPVAYFYFRSCLLQRYNEEAKLLTVRGFAANNLTYNILGVFRYIFHWKFLLSCFSHCNLFLFLDG